MALMFLDVVQHAAPRHCGPGLIPTGHIWTLPWQPCNCLNKDTATLTKWEMFAINVHLSAMACHLPPMLSLLGWILWLRVYLFFVLPVHLGSGDAVPPLPLGPAPASALMHSHFVIAIVVIPVVMTPRRMPTSQPTFFFMCGT
jgi:hypothetical protein